MWSGESFVEGKANCQPNSFAAFGYFLSSAFGSQTSPYPAATTF